MLLVLSLQAPGTWQTINNVEYASELSRALTCFRAYAPAAPARLLEVDAKLTVTCFNRRKIVSAVTSSGCHYRVVESRTRRQAVLGGLKAIIARYLA